MFFTLFYLEEEDDSACVSILCIARESSIRSIERLIDHIINNCHQMQLTLRKPQVCE